MEQNAAGLEAITATKGLRYARHCPELTALYQLVERYYPEFAELLADQGRPLPRYVRREFDEYLKCGRLEYGCAVMPAMLRDCLLFCKRRGFCPSSAALSAIRLAPQLGQKPAHHQATEFTANQWPSILKIMTVRAGLSEQQKSLVTGYLQTHAKDQKEAENIEVAVAPGESKADPLKPKISGDEALAARGAKLFLKYNCNACHGDNARSQVVPAYPKRAGQNADYTFKQLQDFTSRNRANDEFEVMKQSSAQLPEVDMQAIAYWLSVQ